MKKTLVRMIGAALIATMGISCSTSYDSYGNRRQSVNSGAAVVGAVAIGALAYSIGKDDGKKHRRHHRHDDRYDRFDGFRSHSVDRRDFGVSGVGYGSDSNRVNGFYR